MEMSFTREQIEEFRRVAAASNITLEDFQDSLLSTGINRVDRRTKRASKSTEQAKQKEMLFLSSS